MANLGHDGKVVALAMADLTHNGEVKTRLGQCRQGDLDGSSP